MNEILRLATFKEDVHIADGQLIPLSKTTADGQKLYIAARHFQNPIGKPHSCLTFPKLV